MFRLGFPMGEAESSIGSSSLSARALHGRQTMSSASVSTDPACPVCGDTRGRPIASRVRFGYALSTQCCLHCPTAYRSPRAPDAVLLENYESERRADRARAALFTDEGPIPPSDPRYARARRARAEVRAVNALQLSNAQAGDHVLDLECGDGLVLTAAQELFDIVPYGIEPCADQLPALKAGGVAAIQQPIDNLDPGVPFAGRPARGFDRILAFRSLQRVPNPVALLMRCREALAKDGKLVLETSNLSQPHGSLEDNFLQRQDLTLFTLPSLCAILRRTGYIVEECYEGKILYVVARRDSRTLNLPLPFTEDLLGEQPPSGQAVAQCLATYAAMEQTRREIKAQGPDMDRLHALVHQLMQPAFVHHVVDCILDLVDYFMGHEALGLACLVATAASEGPYPQALKAGFERLALSIRASAENGPPDTHLQEATLRELDAASGPVQSAIETIRHEFVLEGAIGHFPALHGERTARKGAGAS